MIDDRYQSMIVLDGCRGIVVMHFLHQGGAVRSVLPRRCCSDVESHTRQGPTDQHNETMRRVIDNQVTVEYCEYPNICTQENQFIKTYSNNYLRLGELHSLKLT